MRVEGLGFRVEGLGLRVAGLGFKVYLDLQTIKSNTLSRAFAPYLYMLLGVPIRKFMSSGTRHSNPKPLV